MVEQWEEGKKGDFLPLPISLPFLRLPRRLSLQLQAHLSEFRGNFLRRSRHPARKSHFSLLDGDSTAKISVPSSSEPARRNVSYAHMADPASNHGRKSSHSRTKKLHACRSRPGHENFRCPGRAWFLLLLSENIHWKCKCAAHKYIIKNCSVKIKNPSGHS